MRSSFRTVVLVACLVVLPTHAQSAEEPQASVAPMPVTRDASPAAAPTPDDIVDMDAVVVSGVLPGPRMWRVSKRSEEHTSELQSLMRISYAVFCLKKKKNNNKQASK